MKAKTSVDSKVNGIATAVTADMNPAASPDVLARFHAENAGKSLRRLPSWIVPENVFSSLRAEQMDDPANTVQRRLFDLYRDRSDWNVLTYCARFSDHDDPRVMERVAEAAKTMRAVGIELLMENDPRLMRDGFLRRFPDEYLRLRQFAVVEADADGFAHFEVRMESMQDYGGRVQYAFWRPGRIVALRAVVRDRMREVFATESACTEEAVSGMVRGLAPGERLLVEVEWPLREIDPASPHLPGYARELMLRYRDLGVAGLMRDEYTFRKAACDAIQEHRAFWYSPHFAEAYARRSGGRGLDDDLPLLAIGLDTPLAHAAAIDYTLTIYDVIKATEEDFYAANKEYFGRDVHVAKHTTWITDICPWEFFGNGLVWWAAPRDWSQSDECNPVPVSTGMMKKFGTPLWLNEGYGPNPEHYVKTLWRYIPCGGRMVYHLIFGWDPAKTSLARYTDLDERAYHAQADLLSVAAIRAEEISRLLPLVTRSPIDCPVAHVFGHERVVDWLSKDDFCNWGKALLEGLGERGYYADAYPATEFDADTFAVDDENYLRVGQQRYSVCILHRLSDRERAKWNALLAGRDIRTRIFTDPEIQEVADCLDEIHAVRQTPLGPDGMGGSKDNRLPPPDGLMFLVDGTAVRVKGASPDFAGDPIAGELETNGCRVRYAARGLCAARCDNGDLTAFAGGEVTCVEGPGLSLTLDEPTDIALAKINGEWHGVWQTPNSSAPVPAPLLAVTPHWIRLRGLANNFRFPEDPPESGLSHQP